MLNEREIREADEAEASGYITFKAGGETLEKEGATFNENEQKDKINESTAVNMEVVPKDIIRSINQFQRKQKKGTIDVWWLYDDGGLTMLIPYILTTRSQWKHCTLRVFTLSDRKDELDLEKRK